MTCCVINLSSKSIVAFESLLKWTHPIINLNCILPYPLLVILVEFRLKYLFTDRTSDVFCLIARWNNNKPCAKFCITLGTLCNRNGLGIWQTRRRPCVSVTTTVRQIMDPILHKALSNKIRTYYTDISPQRQGTNYDYGHGPHSAMPYDSAGNACQGALA